MCSLGLWSEALLLVLYSRLLVPTFALPSLPLSLSAPSPPLVVQSILLVEFSRLYYCISLLWALPDASGCILLSTYLGAGLSSLSTSGAETPPPLLHTRHICCTPIRSFVFVCVLVYFHGQRKIKVHPGLRLPQNRLNTRH